MNPSTRRMVAMATLGLAVALNPQPAVFPRPTVISSRIASSIWRPVA